MNDGGSDEAGFVHVRILSYARPTGYAPNRPYFGESVDPLGHSTSSAHPGVLRPRFRERVYLGHGSRHTRELDLLGVERFGESSERPLASGA